MSAGFATSLARFGKRCTVTIPASGSNGATLAALCGLSTDEVTRCLGFQIQAKQADGTTDRPALALADNQTMTNPHAYAAGALVYEPTIQSINDFARSLTNSTFTAQVVVFLS